MTRLFHSISLRLCNAPQIAKWKTQHRLNNNGNERLNFGNIPIKKIVNLGNNTTINVYSSYRSKVCWNAFKFPKYILFSWKKLVHRLIFTLGHQNILKEYLVLVIVISGVSTGCSHNHNLNSYFSGDSSFSDIHATNLYIQTNQI